MSYDYNDLPEPAPASYADDLEEYIASLDGQKIVVGNHAETRPDASAVEPGFLHLQPRSPIEGTEAYLSVRHVDYEVWIQVDLPPVFDEDVYCETDAFTRVNAQWEFTEPIDADIEYEASHAEEAGHADYATAMSVTAFEDCVGGQCLDTTEPEDVEGAAEFEERPTFEDGVATTGGTLGIPTHSTEDN